MRTLAACAVALAAAAAGCGGSGEPSLPGDALRRAVLAQRDVGAFFRVLEQGPQVTTDAPPPPRADPRRFGRTGGWKARFARSGDSRTGGPLLVVSFVDRFADASGARRELQALARQRRARPLRAPGPLGGDALLARSSQPALGGRVESVLVAWRHGNATASVTADGFGVSDAEAVALARRQQERLAAATGD